MSNAEGDDCIPVPFREYVEERMGSKCELWELALAGLRAEWTLEHKNLIQRFEASENAKILAKGEVDRHFEISNNMQARIDKMTTTFPTKEDLAQVRVEFERRLDEKMKNIWILIMSISATLISAFIMHVVGRI